MKEFIVTKQDAGQRCTKYLLRLMPNAGTGFLYKMLRKKNITLNHKRAEGNEILKADDIITVFFSDETFRTMSGQTEAAQTEEVPVFAKHPVPEENIVYEDDNFLVIYKPSGILSQTDSSGDEALNEQALQYLANRADVTAESLRKYKPGICNRLDRNTAGIVFFAKTLQGSRGMAQALRERLFEKYYFAYVIGKPKRSYDVKVYLSKNEETNTVTISREAVGTDCMPVHTGIEPVVSNDRITLVRIRLYTGKSHQIRSVLQYIGFPVLGDPKYHSDDRQVTGYYQSHYHIHGQQLFAYAYRFPDQVPEGLEELAGETITGLVPDCFSDILNNEFEPSKKGDCYGYLEIPGPSGIPSGGNH